MGPRLHDEDRRFRVLACRWFSGWQQSLIIARPDSVVGWHRNKWERQHAAARPAYLERTPTAFALLGTLTRSKSAGAEWCDSVTITPSS